MKMTLGQPDALVITVFAFVILLSLAITYWAARRTQSTEQFYTAGRKLSGLQNGLALAGDFMSASAFLGTTGMVAIFGFDGMMYAIGGMVGWPILVCLIAEPLRKFGTYTFADVVAHRLQQAPRADCLCCKLADRHQLLSHSADGRGRLPGSYSLRCAV